MSSHALHRAEPTRTLDRMGVSERTETITGLLMGLALIGLLAALGRMIGMANLGIGLLIGVPIGYIISVAVDVVLEGREHDDPEEDQYWAHLKRSV